MAKRKRRIPTPAWERQRGTIGRQVASRGMRFWGVAGIIALAVIAVGLIAYGFINDYVQDQQRPGSAALRVDDASYSVRYFTQRLKEYVQQAGGGSSQAAAPLVAFPTVSEGIIQEAIVLRFAADEGQTVTDDEVDAEIASQLGFNPASGASGQPSATPVETAAAPSETPAQGGGSPSGTPAASPSSTPLRDAPAFQDLVRNEVKGREISETEYRQMIRAQLLSQKLNDKFTADLPASAESIHYRQIQVADQAAADEIKGLLEGGADFAQLAAERSQDEATKTLGGDAGWAPRGYLEKAVEDALFALTPGAITTYPTQSGAFVYQVLEKDANRAIDESQKTTLVARKVEDWLKEKRDQVTIVNHMDLTTGDSDKIRYASDHAYQVLA